MTTQFYATSILLFLLTIMSINTEASPKPMSFNFTGYSIVLVTSDIMLEEDHQLFQSFGKVIFTEINNTYFYHIGQFKTAELATEFLVKVIEQRFPDAEIVYYENGERK